MYVHIVHTALCITDKPEDNFTLNTTRYRDRPYANQWSLQHNERDTVKRRIAQTDDSTIAGSICVLMI